MSIPTQARNSPMKSPGFWNVAGIVAQREVSVRLRSKSFVVSTIITLVLILAAIVFSSFAGDLFSSTSKIATTSSSVATAFQDSETIEAETVGSEAEARALVESGDVDAAVVEAENESGLLVIADSEAPSGLVQALSITPEVEILNPSSNEFLIVYFISIAFGAIYFMSALTFGGTIAQSVVEEKQTRIVEILLSTVSARAMLAGKILGNSALAFGQIILIALIALGAGAATGNTIILDGLGIPILWFVVLFIVGFVMIASLYAATAALVSRSEDLASVQTPITMLVMAPYLLIIIFSSNPLALAIMSYFPFTAPVAIPIRLFTESTLWWEPFITLAIMLVTTAITIWFAAKVYDGSLLRTGAKVKMRDALKNS
ncbi:ABC transporter permease [Humidisolicoccus flavus]|uniref:ABC transporter permease n=1 Tax=Humidisolicoccus flavus TaxID=3111414 RepID=UPI00324FC944